jgi:hypothetical protein
MIDISGFGLQVVLRASNTFPSGITISQFSDDADGVDVQSVQIGDSAMGLNGDLVTWSTANPIAVTINVIPGGEDDKNLAALFSANFPQRGKSSNKDVINMTVNWPDGDIKNYAKGVITEGMPGNSAASAGRKKTKAYNFVFEHQT